MERGHHDVGGLGYRFPQQPNQTRLQVDSEVSWPLSTALVAMNWSFRVTKKDVMSAGQAFKNTLQR